MPVERTGGGDGDGTIGGENASIAKLRKRMPAWEKRGEQANGGAALHVTLMQGEGPRGFEGVADGANAALFRGCE